MSAADRETESVELESYAKLLDLYQREGAAGKPVEAFLRHLKLSEMVEGLYNPEAAKSLVQILGEHANLGQLVPFEQVPVEPSGTFVVSSSPFVDRAPLSAEDQLETLRKQIDDLRTRNERQRSIVAQERRLAAREAQSNSELLAQLDHQRATCDKMVGTLGDMAKANHTLQQALIREKEGRLRMFESHEGVVMHLDEDSVVVTYSIGGDYVDQTYRKDQFIGGRLPQKGDRLAVYVHVAALPKERPDKETSPRSPDDQRRHRKHAGRPPREF